ncbi:MAG: DUF4381 domain-containing protein [Burkholderiales bacterium]|nr:DUF4381 domain-containing protein [Burkholderiales bacterium]
MDASNPLADLKDIHLPTDVSIFPLAPIWYVLISVIIIVIIFLVIRHFVKTAKLKRFNKINVQITELENNIKITDAEVIIEISTLLKRVAMLKFNKKKPEFLYGNKWIEFLNHTGKTTDFSAIHMEGLRNIYKNNIFNNKKQFFTTTRSWVRKVI